MNQEILNINLRKIEQHFWEVEGLPEGDYDEQAVKYDKVISNSFYNKIMWGNSPRDYASFLNDALLKHKDGVIADIGCGTLAFTAQEYAKYKNKNIILSDLSYEMLRIGKSRIEKYSNNSVSFVRADALNLPFKRNSLSSLFSFGFLHIIAKREELLREFYRVLGEGGQLQITSLCTDRKLSGKYLSFLHKKGHVSKPMNSEEIAILIESAGFVITHIKVKGGVTYISALKKVKQFSS